MARRRILDQPVSRLAIWARRLAVFSLLVASLAIIIQRAGLFEILPVLATFAAALLLAAVAILLALASLVPIWRHGAKGLGRAVTAIMMGLLLLAYPSYLGYRALDLPAITDITTDPIDPPRFEMIARLRSRQANPVAYAGASVAEQQRAAYPDIAPLETVSNVQSAYEGAMTIVTKRRWQIITARAPQPGRRDGLIEAVARTPIMGFRDDVVIRVRATSQGARIDVRSASRYGRYDFGTNAARVRALLEDIDAIVNAEKPERPVRPAPKAAQPPAKGAQPARR